MNHRPPTSSVVAAIGAVALAVAIGADAPGVPREATPPSALVGTWRLAEHWNRDSTGALIHQFGPRPVGYFIHDATGHFSVQIMRTPPIGSIPAGPDSVALMGLRALFSGYYGVFGTYTVDTGRGESIYRAEGSSRPDIVGTDARLPYRIAGDSLIIGDGKTWRRVWARLR